MEKKGLILNSSSFFIPKPPMIIFGRHTLFQLTQQIFLDSSHPPYKKFLGIIISDFNTFLGALLYNENKYRANYIKTELIMHYMLTTEG